MEADDVEQQQFDNEDDETSQILWIDELTYARGTLLENLRKQQEVVQFLKVCCVIWPDSNCSLGEYGCQMIWNIVSRLCVLSAAGLIIANFVLIMRDPANFHGFDLSNWSLDLVFILQAVALMCSLVATRRRLASISSSLEVSYFSGSLKYCTVYLAASFFPSILYPIYHILLMTSSEGNNSSVQIAVYCILPFSEIAIAAFLSVHMLFILVDVQTLAANYHQLFGLMKDSSLSSSRARSILREIHYRAGTSLFEVSPIVLIAIVEIVVLSVMVRKDYINNEFVPMLLLTFLFLKEIQFLVLVFMVVVYFAGKQFMLVAEKKRT